MPYCTAADLYDFGLPRGTVPNPGRLAAGADAVGDFVELDVHGFSDGDPVSFRAEAGGTLPNPLVAGTEYYAIAVSDSRFGVALSAGGAAIDLTSSGSGSFVVIAPLPIASAIAWAQQMIDDMCPAHAVPFTDPVPEIIRMTAAELAAGKLLAGKGALSQTIAQMVDNAHKRLARWAKGVPVRSERATARTSLAASATVPYLDPRGWREHGGM